MFIIQTLLFYKTLLPLQPERVNEVMDFYNAIYAILGERIKELRIHKGLNQEILAEKIQMGRASISNIEAGRQQLPISVLYKIADVLGTEVHLLMPTPSEISDYLQSQTDNSHLGDLVNKSNITDKNKETIIDLLKKL